MIGWSLIQFKSPCAYVRVLKRRQVEDTPNRSAQPNCLIQSLSISTFLQETKQSDTQIRFPFERPYFCQVLKALVERRRQVKNMLKSEHNPVKRQQHDIRQQALKLTANR